MPPGDLKTALSITCRECGEAKPLEEFHRAKNMPHGRRTICRSCVSEYGRKKKEELTEEELRAKNERSAHWNRNNPDSRRASRRKTTLKKYGLTEEEYDSMLEAQGGVCAICKGKELLNHPTGTPRSLVVDHHHASNKVRGILCTSCNLAIGNMKDDPELLEAAADYLRGHHAAR